MSALAELFQRRGKVPDNVYSTAFFKYFCKHCFQNIPALNKKNDIAYYDSFVKK